MEQNGKEGFKFLRLPRKKGAEPDSFALHDFEREIIGKSGKKYHLRTPEEGIGMYRVSKLMQLSTQAGFGMNIDQMKANLAKISKHLESFQRDGHGLAKAFAVLGSMETGLNAEVRREFHLSFYTASLFIVAEDEDLKEWSVEAQEEKIEDLLIYHEADFFFLAVAAPIWFLGWLNNTSQTQTEAMRRQMKSASTSGQ